MKYILSFQERAKLGTEQLSKQSPVTLKMARQQAAKLRTLSTTKTGRKEIRKLHF